MTTGPLRGRRLTLAMSLLAIALPVAAQEGTPEHEAEGGHHKYALAGFVGSTRVHGENEFTLGIEGGYRISANWNVGFVVERAERERDTTLVLVGVGWHPFGPEWRLQLAAGIKDPSGTTEAVVRTGLGYEIEFESGWAVKPYVAVDFINNEDNEGVFGVYIGRRF